MLAKTTIFVTSILAAHVVAQGSTLNSTIDPTTVDPTTRSQWCGSQQNVCAELCLNNFYNSTSHTCNATELTWNCTCQNGTAPGLQYYSGSMDALICQRNYQNCIVAGQNNQTAQDICTTNQQANCGMNDAANYTAPSTTSSSSQAMSSTGSVGPASTASTTSTSTSKNAAATMLAVGQNYGTGVLAVGVAMAFGVIS